MYAALGIYPDIAYSAQILSKFSKNPREIHWKVIKWVFCYLKGIQDLWLTYGGAGKKLIGFADADSNMAKNCHAILRYAFIINSSAVFWSANHQELVTLSITESKYISIIQYVCCTECGMMAAE